MLLVRALKNTSYLCDKPTAAYLQICSVTYYYSSPTCFDYSSDHHFGGL